MRFVLTLRRARRPLALVCLAAVALAGFVPAAAALELAPPLPEFVLLPLLEPLDVVTAVSVPVEQPETLRALLPERAPPIA